MTDLSTTIDPKSDQLNSDDLIAGPRTITVTRVTGNNDKDQPISIFFEGDNGKPYKPCKSMRRVLVQLWGSNGATYTGKSMTLFRDPSVKFGGIEVGGIRISHMSHIDADVKLMLTATRGKKDPYHVKKLVAQADAAAPVLEDIAAADTIEALTEIGPRAKELKEKRLVPPPRYKQVVDAFSAKKQELEAAAANAETADDYDAALA